MYSPIKVYISDITLESDPKSAKLFYVILSDSIGRILTKKFVVAESSEEACSTVEDEEGLHNKNITGDVCTLNVDTPGDKILYGLKQTYIKTGWTPA